MCAHAETRGQNAFLRSIRCELQRQSNSCESPAKRKYRTFAAARISLRSKKSRRVSELSTIRLGNARANESRGIFGSVSLVLLFKGIRLFGRRTNAVSGRKIAATAEFDG